MVELDLHLPIRLYWCLINLAQGQLYLFFVYPLPYNANMSIIFNADLSTKFNQKWFINLRTDSM
jgi:hypothetical protein